MPDLDALRVLVIEDDADTRANLADVLELDGAVVESVGSLGAAYAFPRWGEIDAVLLDRQLPDGTAEEALPRIQELAPQAAVLVVTGYADLDGAIRALRQRAEDYLVKPINPDLLRSSLHRVTKLKRAEHEAHSRAMQQGVVARLGQEALRGAPLEELFRKALEEVTRNLSVDLARVRELTADGLHLITRAKVGIDCDCGEGEEPLLPASQAGRTLSSGLPLALESLAVESLAAAVELGPSCPHVPSLTAGACIVIHGAKRPFGVLCIHSTEKRVFTPSDIDFLQAVANVLAAGIDRKQGEERALQAERLAAIGQVVAGLAHESRNALQRSLACLEMLAMEVEDRPEALDLVRRTQRAQDHLHKLFEEVRGYAAPVRLEVCDFGLPMIWREAWQVLSQQRAGRDAQLRETIGCDDLELGVDHFRMVQVFRNLFENALAACRDPVVIDVVCEPAFLAGQPAVRVAVRDNGPGLTADQAERVFEPFFTTKTHGTGLGMPIAHRIVAAHGGTLSVGERERPGAEFVLTLPRRLA